MRLTQLHLKVGVIFLFASAAGIQAGDWPGFRGPTGDGVSQKEKAPIYFGPSSNLLWKTELPFGHSSPVICKDQIFLTGEQSNKLSTICLNKFSGKKLWEQTVTPEKLEPIHSSNSHATSTPVTDGKNVYVYFGSFGMIAYDLAGKEIWRKPLPIPRTFNNQGTGTSPVLADNKLLIFIQIGSESHLLALNPADGNELWKAPMPLYNNSYGTPVIWSEEGKTFAGLACATRFSAFRVSDGKEMWWVNDIGFQACSTPVSLGDRLVLSSAGAFGDASNVTAPPAFEEMIKNYDQNGDGLIGYDEIPNALLYTDRHASQGQGNMSLKSAYRMFGGVKKDDKLDSAKWESIRGALSDFRVGQMNRAVALCVRTGGKEDVTSSHVIWKEVKGVPEVPSPLVFDKQVYMIRNGGILVCRDVDTGKLIYENRIDSPGGYFASPIEAGGSIYVCSDRGAITVIKPGNSFEVLARNELQEPINASPAIVDNTLFVRSANRLWAFADKAI
jgi:outer membrane protein assembly factor BamB